MMRDAFGFEASTTSAVATGAFEQAVHGLGAHQPGTAAAIEATLSADADHVGAIALKGFANLILAREELMAPARDALHAARHALRRRYGGTMDERRLVDALQDAVDGHFAAAANRIDAGYADRPATFLPFKIAHALRFMLGDATGMLTSTERMLEDWRADDRAAGFLLGCHAFALEEHGRYDEAESFGHRAVALQPEDAWGLHAVSHVHEMRGEVERGIDWLEGNRVHWSRCNNFSFHMAWHLALLHLERGDKDRVLALYDREVRPQQTDDFRDMANAVSLLWRMERLGLDVGPRWSELAHIARRRRTDTSLVFASLHTLFALTALGDRAAAAELIAALEAKAQGAGDQARIARDVGLPVARVVAGWAGDDRRGLDGLADALPRLGGSNAQRDVFLLALAETATRRGDRRALDGIRHARGRLKHEDRLVAAIDDRTVSRRRVA